MPSQPISEYQFQKLLEEVAKEKNFRIRLRDTLFYELMYYLGLRPMEARCIEIPHINFLEKKIFIPADHNKERQADDIFIPDFIWNRILDYLQKRKIKSHWLFPCLLHHSKEKDIVQDSRCQQRDFTNRLKRLGFIHVNYVDRQGIPRYNLNLYSFRKRFGTFAYKKTRCPQTTALLLRQYDKQLKSVWRYVFAVQKEERKQLMQELYN